MAGGRVGGQAGGRAGGWAGGRAGGYPSGPIVVSRRFAARCLFREEKCHEKPLGPGQRVGGLSE